MCRQKTEEVHNPTSIAPPRQFQIESTSTSKSSSLRSLAAEKSKQLFTPSELAAATNGFKSLKLGNSATWKCTLRGQPAVVSCQIVADPRNFRADLLIDLCKVRHRGIAQLIGACFHGSHMYLVHEFVPGTNLGNCLRGSRVFGYSAIWKWTHRVRVGLDIAKALEYLHHDIPIRYVHKHVKPSCIIVSEPEYRAQLVHFGSHALTWEPPGEGRATMRRNGSMKIRGTQGYMAPEYLRKGYITPKMDVYAFGVVLLELVTGEMAVRYEYEESRDVYKKISLVDEVGRLDGDLRLWVDGRMMDSYPMDCMKMVVEIARACVDPAPEKRPDMRWVSAKISKVLTESERWAEEMRVTERVSLSLACR